jgi:hypothetical protein
MDNPRRCKALIAVVLKEINRSAAGARIPRFSTPESRLYLACVQATRIQSEEYPSEIFELLEKVGDAAGEARRAHERGDTEAERRHVNKAVDSYRQALGKIEESGLEEKQAHIVTFNNLVRRHNALNPDQSKGPEL